MSHLAHDTTIKKIVVILLFGMYMAICLHIASPRPSGTESSSILIEIHKRGYESSPPMLSLK
jgi:hypothetical protein